MNDIKVEFDYCPECGELLVKYDIYDEVQDINVEQADCNQCNCTYDGFGGKY